MNTLKFIVLSFITLTITSCATKYKATNPTTTPYYQKSEGINATIAYKYDILRSKYSRKEDRKDLHVVAAQITNTSDKDLILGDNLFIADEKGTVKTISTPNELYKSLKQLPGTHFFYLLLSPVRFNTFSTDQYGNQHVNNSIPVGYLLGPGLSLGNYFTAKKANKNFKENITEYFIDGAVIKPGETISGLIGINGKSREPLIVVTK